MAAYSLLEMVQNCLARMEKKPISTMASLTDEARFIGDTLASAHRWVCGIHSWDWLRTEGEVFLVPAVATTFTTDATAVFTCTTLGATAPYALYSNGWASFTGKDVLKLGTMTGVTGGSFALANPHGVGTPAGYVLQDTYSLPTDFDRPTSSASFIAGPWKMTAYDPERFLKLRTYDSALVPLFTTTAQPDSYTIWGEGDGSQKLVVWPFPAVAQTLSIRYIRKPAEFVQGSTDGSAIYPEIPEKYQNVLIYRALDLYYRDKELDMTKRTMWHSMFVNTLQSMLGTVERTSDRMAMQPNTSRQAYSA
jgi:hypothetical protein